MSKQTVLKLALNCEKCKRRAMKILAGISGVDSIKIDAVESKIIVTGDADPVCLASSLRKFGSAELVSVGPPVKEIKKEVTRENIGYFILPRSCDRCSGYTYYWIDDNANACSIL